MPSQIISNRISDDWKIKLSKIDNIDCYDPPIDFFVELIEDKIPFSFSKLNHAFWEAAIERNKFDNIRSYFINEDARKSALMNPVWNQASWFALHGFDLLDEVVEIVSNLKPDSNHLLGVSHIGPPDESIFVGNLSYKNRLDYIKHVLPNGYTPFFGAILKKYALSGVMHKLFDSIRSFRVVVVGIDHVEHLNKYTMFNDFKHINIKLLSATDLRYCLLDTFINEWKDGDFWIFQAGETLSTWFISKMSDVLKTGMFIDAGRSIDMFIPSDNLVISGESALLIPDINRQRWMLNRAEHLKTFEFGNETISLGISYGN